MLDEISATLGGRAAEEVIFGTVSTGALNDLERVTKQAYAMVAYYGLNDNIGNLSYYDSSGQSEYSFNRPYSEKTAETIDKEVHTLIETAYQRAKEILDANKDKLSQLAEQLLSKEVIFRENLVEIFGERPFDDEESENKVEINEESEQSSSTVEDIDTTQEENADNLNKNNS